MLLLLVFIVALVVSLVFVGLARLTQTRHRMRGTDDVETAYVTSICTLYGIFIAFMIFTVWNRYEEARLSVTIEANTVAEVYRLAGGLQDPLRTEVKSLSMEYARSVVNDEWVTMLHGKPSPRTEAIVRRMWALFNRMPEEVKDSVIRDHMLTAWTTLADRRRMRLLWSYTGLSEYAYVVLFAGAAITIGLAAVFTVDNFGTHLVKATSLAAMIALMLATVWGLGHPFRGAVRLQALPFKQIITMLSAEP